MQKSLDTKLFHLAADRNHSSFILADAKDADMAFGIGSPGKNPLTGKIRSISEFREQIAQIVQRGLVDIMLMSASTSECLTLQDRLFDNSPVTPAVRINDTTDIHGVRGGCYPGEPSAPFASTTIDHVQTGRYPRGDRDPAEGANLGLYSVTFNNLPREDLATLQAYKDFRLEAEAKCFHHFLEVFNPNVGPKIHGIAPGKIGGFVNDHIVRMLAGVPKSSRPRFLKIAYHGPESMEEICGYDSSLVIGILGGSAGTTHDAFHLLHDAKRHGARVALFGRKINAAEHQVTFVEHLRHVADGHLQPKDAVRSYHASLEKLGIKPIRLLAKDMALTVQYSAYRQAAPRPAKRNPPAGKR